MFFIIDIVCPEKWRVCVLGITGIIIDSSFHCAFPNFTSKAAVSVTPTLNIFNPVLQQ